MDYKAFFGRNSEIVAKELVGKTLKRTYDHRTSVSGKILETGAYKDGKRTQSRTGMLYAPGTLFLMPFRGYQLFNIATDKENIPSCVEIRRIQVKDKEIEGPGAISKFLGIEDLDGIVLGNELRILESAKPVSKIKKLQGSANNCLCYFLIDSKPKQR